MDACHSYTAVFPFESEKWFLLCLGLSPLFVMENPGRHIHWAETKNLLKLEREGILVHMYGGKSTMCLCAYDLGLLCGLFDVTQKDFLLVMRMSYPTCIPSFPFLSLTETS